jgi:hypothetical protein
MPNVVGNRIAVVVIAALVGGGVATAVALAFPGRPSVATVAEPPSGIVATPDVVQATLPPTPSPTPTPTPERVVASSRSGSGHVSPPATAAPRSGGSVSGCGAMTGPACKAITNPPGGPPEQPKQPQNNPPDD